MALLPAFIGVKWKPKYIHQQMNKLLNLHAVLKCQNSWSLHHTTASKININFSLCQKGVKKNRILLNPSVVRILCCGLESAQFHFQLKSALLDALSKWEEGWSWPWREGLTWDFTFLLVNRVARGSECNAQKHKKTAFTKFHTQILFFLDEPHFNYCS